MRNDPTTRATTKNRSFLLKRYNVTLLWELNRREQETWTGDRDKGTEEKMLQCFWRVGHNVAMESCCRKERESDREI